MSTPVILAIDLGTSGCKAALITTRGEVLAWESEEVKTILFPNGGAEQRPQDWWNALRNTARKIIASGVVEPSRIVGVCCNTQGEGTVPVDRDGNALHNCILWMDSRGAEALKQHVRGPISFEGYRIPWLYRWLRLTGGAPSITGKDPAAHMLYFRDKHPDIYARTHKFLNVLDYLNLRLTGRSVATFDSIATSWVTDNRNPDNIRYHRDLIAQSGIDADKFPEIVRCTDVIGEVLPAVAEDLGLPRGVKVVAGSIDNTAAAIGSGAVRDYDSHLYLGTSSWITCHVPKKKTDVFAEMATVPCAVPGRYLFMAMQTTAGGNLSFLRDNILYHKDELLQEAQMPDVFKIMDRIAEATPPGSNGVIYTPWIYGERSPVKDSNVRAGIYNLSLENTRADIIRAVLEGIALNTRWLLGAYEKNTGRRADPITAVGGGAVSSVWCRIFADVLDRPVRQLADPIRANAVGAAYIAAVGLGELSFDAIPELTKYRADYEPNPHHRDLYDERYAVFSQLYKQNRGIYRRLNGR
jgi:xylulokinase